MKKITVSICIPAYNEQHNIDNLLKRLFSQKQKGFMIVEIVVASDGSTDSTVKIARKYEKHGVTVLEGKNNRGQTYRQNELISRTSAAILVLLNADLLLEDENVIARLIAPVLEGADLSAQWAMPFWPSTFFEKILHAGFMLKYYVYTRHKQGNNIYTCVGHMRALSRNFYSNVEFPRVSEGEDQYLYLTCINEGFNYKYTETSNAYFKLPSSFSDYKKYAKRIFQTQTKFADVFSEELTSNERALPIKLQLQGCLHAFRKTPLCTLLYILLHIVFQQWAIRQPINKSHVFEVASSTKKFSLTES